jgi:hypothetical protein
MMFERWARALCFLDLTTGNKPSFSKLVCLTILVATIWQGKLTLGIVIALLAASFGRSVFIAFLNRANIAANESHATTKQEILERRVEGLGVEATP